MHSSLFIWCNRLTRCWGGLSQSLKIFNQHLSPTFLSLISHIYILSAHKMLRCSFTTFHNLWWDCSPIFFCRLYLIFIFHRLTRCLGGLSQSFTIFNRSIIFFDRLYLIFIFHRLTRCRGGLWKSNFITLKAVLLVLKWYDTIIDFGYLIKLVEPFVIYINVSTPVWVAI